MSTENKSALERWQPYFFIVPMILMGVFVAVSYLQVADIQKRIATTGAVDLSLERTDSLVLSELGGPTRMQYAQWRMLANMEQRGMDKRYDQAGLLVLSRIFTKYMGFLTGMIMAIAGAVFVVGRIKEDESRGSGSGTGWKVTFRTSSPGIIFGILGSVLMVFAITEHHSMEVDDQAQYLIPFNVYVLGQDGDTTAQKEYMEVLLHQLPPKGKDTTEGFLIGEP